jgi:spore maturation protein CgeB
MNRLLIVGGTEEWAIETYYCKYLNQLGMETTIFEPSKHIRYHFWNKIRNRLGDLSIYNTINKSLIKYCSLEKPDIVWVFKGVEIFPDTLLQLKKLGIILVNYNPDHPFIRTSVTHGGKNIEECVPLYDIHFSYRQDLVNRFIEEFRVKSYILPFGYDLDETVYDIVSKEKEIKKLCFVGTPDKERVEILNKIANQGFEIDIFGRGYQNRNILEKHKNIKVYDVVLGNEFWKTIIKYRVQLNFFRKHNIGSHNQRTFEVPAVGGILLSPYSQDQSNFFNDKEEIFLFKNENEMFSQIETLLRCSNEKIKDIRFAARSRSLESDYSYYHRAENVNKIFKSL